MLLAAALLHLSCKRSIRCYGITQQLDYANGIGRGEFALEFGDYEVSLTVPADHIVAATGTLTNAGEVLSAVQQERLKRAEGNDEPTYVVTPAEAKENEKNKAEGTKTWVFHAQNVRDFAWASSRKFVWDAAHVQVGDREDRVWAMSFFLRGWNEWG